MESTPGASAPRVALTPADAKKLMDVAMHMQRLGQKGHPKYQQIVLLLKQYQQQQQQQHLQRQLQAQQNQNQSLDTAANPFLQQKTALFSDKQLEYLHNQIRAYKALCHSMDSAIAQAKQLSAAGLTMDPSSLLMGQQNQMQNQIQSPAAAVDPPVLELLTPKWTRAARNLLYVGPNYLDGDLIGIENKGNLAFGPFNICTPWLGANDVALKTRYMHTLQQFLASSLERMESHTGELDENEQRTLRDLRCVLLQQKLQRHVAKTHSTRLALLGEPAAVDRKSFRRRRPVSRVELQSDEREKRKKSVAMEKKRRADHQMYLKAVLNHSRDFFAYHKNVKAQVSKSAKAVKGFIDQRASKAEREEDRQEKLRLKALKANDMEAYGKLVAEAKNERLTYLLSQTNSYLDSIRQLVRQHKRKHHVVDEYTAHYDAHHEGNKDTNADDLDDDLNYLEIASKGELPRQPLMLVGGDLKEYQLRGLQWMVSLYDNHLNGILADEMGLGKTIQSISLLTYVMEVKHNHGPFLVVVPLSTLSNWVNEFKKWAPDIVLVVYKGPPQVRKELHRQEMASCQFNVLLTTYEYIMKDKHVLRKYDWQYIIVDEGHRMKNAQSKFAMTLGSMYTSRNRLLLTGTPLQNSLPELWALLNFLLPTIFESVDTFEQWFSKPFAQFSGSGESNELSDEERMLIINRLHQVLRPFLLRRVKASVLDQLPDKVEKVLKCELSGWQKIMYRRIQEGGALLMETTDGSGKKKGKTKYTSKGLSNVLMQLRKVCNHPYLFQTNGYQIDFDIIRSSGKFELLDRMLPKLKAAGHRVLMFSQMTQLMHVLEDYFNYRGFRYLRLDGSTSADEREQRMFMFNAPDSPFFIFLLSTRAGGLGLNLATADTVIIFDSDWNPAMDAQAQDRAHRIGQKNEVRVFRLVTNSPVEEKILSRATDKMNMNNLVVEAGKFNNRSKEAERRAMLESLIKMEQEEAAHAAHDDESSNVLLDDEINEMMALTDEELALYHRFDAERTTREAKEWEDYCRQYSIPHAPRTRLMSEKDAPVWLREANEVMEHDIASGKHDQDSWDFEMEAVAGKPRKRKEMSYRDQFTDAEFVKMCEDGIDEDELKAAAKEPKPGKRKRDEDEEFVDAAAAEEEEENPDEDDAARRERKMLCYYYRKVYDAVMKLKDPSGRLRSDLYVEKPSAADYPDYYTIVTEPMDLATIKARLDKYHYTSHEQFEGDFTLMIGNAQLYNHPESLVVYDALEIDKCVKAKMKPLHAKTMEQIAAAYEKAKKDHKRRSKQRKDKKRRQH
jgi:ATP-dependent helicase STH1/SNF2